MFLYFEYQSYAWVISNTRNFQEVSEFKLKWLLKKKTISL